METLDIKNIMEAGKIVSDELIRRGYDILSRSWINDYRNILFTTEKDLTSFSFFLKFDKNPYYAVGKELEDDGEPTINGTGVCINKHVFNMFITPCEAEILYALPANIYYIPYQSFRLQGIPHRQHTNDEAVIVIALNEFTNWMLGENEDKNTKHGNSDDKNTKLDSFSGDNK